MNRILKHQLLGARPPQDLRKTSARPPQDLRKTSTRPPQDLRKTSKELRKTSCGGLAEVLQRSCGAPQDLRKGKNSSARPFLKGLAEASARFACCHRSCTDSLTGQLCIYLPPSLVQANQSLDSQNFRSFVNSVKQKKGARYEGLIKVNFIPKSTATLPGPPPFLVF